jgi:hypothetical protein
MDIQAEIRRTQQLLDELVKRANQGNSVEALEKAQPKIERGTKAHEQLLSTGYDGMTKAEAEAVIKERDADPTRWPMADYKKAKAYLAALKAKPAVISTRSAWRRRQHARVTGAA